MDRSGRTFARLSGALVVAGSLAPGGPVSAQQSLAPAPAASAPAKPAPAASLDGPAQLVAQQWAHLWNTESLDALMALYAKDAEFYPTSGERIAGTAALRALFAAALAANKPAITMTSVTSSRSGTLAFDAGDYVEIITRKGNGTAFPVTGRYLLICRQGPGGHWLIAQQMWTESAAKAR
jgi:ketosteroid isomerase-like protein